MRTKLIAVALALAFGISAGASLAQGRDVLSDIPPGLADHLQDSFIFVFGPSVRSDQVAARAAGLTRAHGGRLGHVYTTAIRGFSANLPPQAAARLAAQNPSIQYYESDGLVRATPKPPWAGGGDKDATPDPQVTPLGIARVGGPFDGTGLFAWVIDTGIDFDHADLNVDTALSKNFVSRGKKKGGAKDGNGHGTHVGGTIGAKNNEINVVGVAAGATLVAIRVLDNSGSGSISDVVAGVDYVAANAKSGDVANVSLGGAGHWSSLHDAILAAADKGILFALAAGNSGADAENYEPAHIDHENVYTVSAINAENDNFASFSNYGNPPVDFAAPGVNVLSTQNGGGTTTFSGTSMAAPHVAGLLLFGPPSSYGTATGDPDGNPDPIAYY